MKILNESISLSPLAALRPHPRNPRRGDTSLIAESISENGFWGAVVAQRSTVFILAGNHRYLAAKLAGATEIPVAWVDVGDVAAEKILLADNRTSDVATYDEALLASLLQEVAEADSLVGTGYTDADLAAMLPSNPVRDSEPDPPDESIHAALVEKWGVESGQIWHIGGHRIMCADCTDADAVGAIMAGSAADLLLTDPPYGVSYKGKTKQSLTIEGDSLDHAGLIGLIGGSFDQAERATRPGAYWYATVPARPLHLLFAADWERRGILRQVLVWVKNSLVMGHSEYHYQHEPILFGWRPGGQRWRNPDRTRSTVWAIDRPSQSTLHPTMKPVALWSKAITDATEHGNLVYDPFCGSGTTILAAESTGRIARCMEMDPRYVAVILERCSLASIGPITLGE